MIGKTAKEHQISIFEVTPERTTEWRNEGGSTGSLFIGITKTNRYHNQKEVFYTIFKGLVKGVWQAFKYLLLTPSCGSKRRAELQVYEDRLDEAAKRSQAEMDGKADG